MEQHLGETLQNSAIIGMRRIQSNLLHLKGCAGRGSISHPGHPAAATLLNDVERCLVQLDPNRLTNSEIGRWAALSRIGL